MRYHEIIESDAGLPAAAVVNSPAFRAWFRDSKVVDAQGNPLPVYHGTQRPDRVGNRFRKSRATAGPMAYFTDSPTLASNYAASKSDSSIGDTDYPSWFMVKPPGGRREIPIDRAWQYLTPEQRRHMLALAPRVTRDDDGTIYLAGPEHTSGVGGFDYHLREARGNALLALVDHWLFGGVLYGDEEKFLQVLRLAGFPWPVRYNDPNATYPFVYAVFLSIQNPLVTTAIPQPVLDALATAAVHQRTPQYARSGWDKRDIDARAWLRDLLDDIERTGGALSWTVVPDWVTRVLTRFGYDGIKDVGGKNGGASHTVWIPFEERQVKSAITNSRFDPAKRGIHEIAFPLDRRSRNR